MRSLSLAIIAADPERAKVPVSVPSSALSFEQSAGKLCCVNPVRTKARLTPKQHSTGGKEKLGGISKRGDSYIRRLLIHGARATVARVRSGQMKSAWLSGLLGRRHFNVATVALANKTARVAWASCRQSKPIEGPPNSWASIGFGCARANGRMRASRSDRNWLIPLALSGSKARQNNWAPVRVSHQGQQRRCVKDRIDSCNRALPGCRRRPCIAGTVHR
jgi:hypothetical protein